MFGLSTGLAADAGTQVLATSRTVDKCIAIRVTILKLFRMAVACRLFLIAFLFSVFLFPHLRREVNPPAVQRS